MLVDMSFTQIAVLPWILLWIIFASVHSEAISSTGPHPSDAFQWAVGVDRLDFHYEYICDPDNDKQCYYDWAYNLNETDNVTLTVDGYGGRPVCHFKYTTIEIREIVFGGVLHKIDCEYNVSCSCLTSTYTVLSNASEVQNESYVEIRIKDAILSNKTILLKYCPELKSSQQELMITVDGDAEYLTNASYSCDTSAPSAVVVKNNFLESTQLFIQTCMYNASWSDDVNIICSYGPKPTLKINGTASFTYFEEDFLTLSCQGNLGYPEALEESLAYMIETSGRNETIKSSFTLTAEHHDGNISCSAGNNYTIYIGDGSPGKSDPVNIKVLFAPKATDNHEETLEAQIGQQLTLRFPFTANPEAHLNGTSLEFLAFNKAAWTPLGHEKSYLTGGSLQTYSYNLSIVTNESFGIFRLMVNSSEDHFKKVPLFMKISLNETVETATFTPNTTPQPEILGAIIGASVAALAAIILCFVLVLLKIGKRNKKQSEDPTIREERDNPMYGTAAGPSSGAEYAMVNKTGKENTTKEERVNPLYGSNTNPDGVEEAYAAVDTKKKKKKNKTNKGNENAAFSIEGNAAVYAAVNKPKKTKNEVPPSEAVYSEVNKNKKNKDITADTALHGSPE